MERGGGRVSPNAVEAKKLSKTARDSCVLDSEVAYIGDDMRETGPVRGTWLFLTRVL